MGRERTKRYVPVIVRFEADGYMRPQIIEFDEGHKYPIDRILDVRRAACESVGGVGDRYTVRVQGQERYLWFERDRWVWRLCNNKAIKYFHAPRFMLY